MENVVKALNLGLKDHSNKVRYAALNAATANITVYCDDEKEAGVFKSLMQPIINVVQAMAKSSDSKLSKAVQNLVEITTDVPKFFRPVLVPLARMMTAMTQAKQFDAGLHNTCLEVRNDRTLF